MEQTKTVIIIVGPTAVGKTAFAIEIAKRLNTAIISADSRQCYKELNIGVAKPTEKELQQVKHYFINSHSITDEVNAVTFEQYALKTAAQVFQTHDTLVMVGGTGLYIKAFIEGLDDIPPVDEQVRSSIILQYQQNGLEWLQNEVRQKDPRFWLHAEQENPQRLMRALEVITSTGKSIDDFRNGAKQSRPFRVILIGLELPREALYDRINQRVDQMMTSGLENEARSLLSARHLNALQTVGYRELFEYFDGQLSLDKAVSEIKTHSRHYAKRQLTWFKKDETTRWFAADASPESVLQQVLTD
jgi:tRNA dimethylallyltransferase